LSFQGKPNVLLESVRQSISWQVLLTNSMPTLSLHPNTISSVP